MPTLGSNIVLLCPERLGDTIFCTPGIHLLRTAYPEAIITVVSFTNLAAQVFTNSPDINNILVDPSKNDFLALANNADVVIDLIDNEYSQPFATLVSQPCFIIPRDGGIQNSTLVLDFVRTLIPDATLKIEEHYRLYPSEADHQAIQQLLRENGASFDDNEILIGCHMGNFKTASRLRKFWKRQYYSKKTWPVDKFAELQKKLYAKNPNIKLVLTGSKGEEKLVSELHKKLPNTIDIIAKTSVLTLAALMQYVSVYLTGDTGPLHVAASSEVPIIALFGPSDSSKTGPRPLRKQHTLIQRIPLSDLPVDEVIEVLNEYC